jgi:hypothetical protein
MGLRRYKECKQFEYKRRDDRSGRGSIGGLLLFLALGFAGMAWFMSESVYAPDMQTIKTSDIHIAK